MRVAWTLGAAGRAATLLRASLEQRRALDDHQGTAEGLEAVALVAGPDHPDAAARLLGAADALRATTGAMRPPVEAAGCEETTRTLRARLGEVAFAAALAAGRSLSPDQAVAEAAAIAAAAPGGGGAAP
jgi:hypothetical protein